MTAYSDKVDASYAKLKAVLAEGASAVAGFKSSLPKKSQVLTRRLSEEVVHVLLEEIMQFVMHMTSASIDQVSGRLEEKLAALGEDGLMLSDETVQKIKGALAGLPGASSAVAQALNGLGKSKCISQLVEFFQTEFPENSSDGKAEFAGENESAGAEDSDGEWDQQLSDKGVRKKFAEYLDKALPETKYFNQFFQRVFDAVDEVSGRFAAFQGLAVMPGGERDGKQYLRLQNAALMLDDAVQRLAQAVSCGLDISGTSKAVDLAAEQVQGAVKHVKAAVFVLGFTVAAAAGIAAAVSQSMLSAVLFAVAGVSAVVMMISKNITALFNSVLKALKAIVKTVFQAVKLVFTIIWTVVKTIIGIIIGVVAAVIIALGLVVLLGLAALVAAFVAAVALVALAVVAALVAAAVIVAAVVAVAVVMVAALAVVLAAALLVVVALLAVAVLAAAALAAVAVLLAAAAVVAVFIVMAAVAIAAALAVAALAVSILAVGLALSVGLALIAAAVAFGAVVLMSAVMLGVGTIFYFAMLAAYAIMGMAVLAAGSFMAAAFVFAGVLVGGLIGLITGVVVALLALFLLGMLLIGATVQEIWDYLQPFWDRIKGWWKEIVAWWDSSFLKKMLDKAYELGWLDFMCWLFCEAIDGITNWFMSTEIGKWVQSVLDWWDKFSIKGILKQFWESFKSWILEKWNIFCDWIVGVNIPYPTGLSYQGPDHWWSYMNPFNWKIDWGYWYVFKSASGWKHEVPKDQVGDIPPPDEPDADDAAAVYEMQKEIDAGLTSEDVKEINLAKNVFEQDRLRKEAIRRRREQLRDNPIVVPQVVTYPGQPQYGGGGNAGVYSGTLGGGYIGR